MKTGPKGLALIKDFEGCELKAYKDAVGVWTIGFGHTAMAGAPTPKAGMVITAGEAEEILKRDLLKYEDAVIKAVKVPLNQEQFDALVSFTFNCGPANFRGSTLLKKLNAGDYAAVPAQLMRWNKAGGKVLKGLTRRREAEGFLWSTKTAPAAIQTPPDVETIPTKDQEMIKTLIIPFIKSYAPNTIRHLGTLAAGSLLTSGAIDAAQGEVVSGAVIGLLTVLWSVLEKKGLLNKIFA